jgi:hypothetical protein
MRKVRLPAGKYVQPGFRQWCTLSDAQGMLLATDGQSASRVLLDYQTSVSLVPNTPLEARLAGQRDLLQPVPNQQETLVQSSMPQPNTRGVDAYWQKKYNPFLWFQFTPRQLAVLYNEQPVTRDGQAWVDFSAQSLQPDGKHDGGDALELRARRNRESKTAESVTLREAARMLVREARDALERAARADEQVPTWVTEIMTEAGWQRYRSLYAEAAKAGTATASRG